MNAALLCPGPSLTQTYPPAAGRHDVNIGVNRAVLAFRCHWWAFVDWQTYIETGRQACRTFVSRTADRELRRRTGDFTPDLTFESIDLDRTRNSIRWGMFSATAALFLASHLGATSVDVYGADWTNEPDYDGHRTERDRRTVERWADERIVWDRTIEHLGLSVTRHGNL